MTTSVVFKELGEDGNAKVDHWPGCSAMYEPEERELTIVNLENSVQHVYVEPEKISLVVMNFGE